MKVQRYIKFLDLVIWLFGSILLNKKGGRVSAAQ